jgi:hypothetical protein
MGLLDDLDAAERTEREPLRSRLLRRIGGGLAAAGVLMCLLGLLGGKWWQLEFDSGPIAIGLSKINYCSDDIIGDRCDAIPDDEFVSYAASRSGGEKEDRARIGAWLDTRTPAKYGLALAILACVALAVVSLGPRRRDHTRIVAGACALVGAGALVLVWRFVGTTPFDLLSRSLHSYLGVAGLVDLVIGAALVGLPSPHVALPTAKLVARG